MNLNQLKKIAEEQMARWKEPLTRYSNPTLLISFDPAKQEFHCTWVRAIKRGWIPIHRFKRSLPEFGMNSKEWARCFVDFAKFFEAIGKFDRKDYGDQLEMFK